MSQQEIYEEKEITGIKSHPSMVWFTFYVEKIDVKLNKEWDFKISK